MPTYTYICEECQNQIEIRKPFSSTTAEVPKTCEECSGRLRRVILVPTVHYRGTGFYSTDHERRNNAE